MGPRSSESPLGSEVTTPLGLARPWGPGGPEVALQTHWALQS